MSRAFDTIDRAKLVQILKDEVKLEEDEMRMCQSLLANTNLKVKLGEAVSDPFATTIGSPLLFTSKVHSGKYGLKLQKCTHGPQAIMSSLRRPSMPMIPILSARALASLSS